MLDLDRNGASSAARAFATYSLIPYLGILFCPGALIIGGVGVFQSYYRPERDGRVAGYVSLAVGLIVLVAQLILWWILYRVPEWSRGLYPGARASCPHWY